MCHCARDTVDISRDDAARGESFIGNLVAVLWMSLDNDCRGYTSQVSSDARTAIRIFVAIVARRPNRIAGARYISDIPFFIPPGSRRMDATDGCARCAHRRARYFRETALRYCARVHVSAMLPFYSQEYCQISTCSIFRMCVYVQIFFDDSMKFFIVLHTYLGLERTAGSREYRDGIGDPISRCIVSRI